MHPSPVQKQKSYNSLEIACMALGSLGYDATRFDSLAVGNNIYMFASRGAPSICPIQLLASNTKVHLTQPNQPVAILNFLPSQ